MDGRQAIYSARCQGLPGPWTRNPILRAYRFTISSVEEIAVAGNKAATLASLRRARFPVPKGVVLTTESLADALAVAELDHGARQAAIEAMSLPNPLTHALPAAERLGCDRRVVRSSGSTSCADSIALGGLGDR